MPRNPIEKSNVSFEDRFGTTASGNLSQYKIGQNLCDVIIDNITYPDIKIEDFRYHYLMCPYSTQASDSEHLIRNIDLSDPNYFNMEEVPQDKWSSHDSTGGRMIRHSPGGRIWGHLCVDDLCSFYIETGKRYFYR